MKRTLNTILFLFAALTMVAQNSFVVADKNGNSQFVQSLIFQQQQNADRFTWKAGSTIGMGRNSPTGDIKDLLFVARAKSEMANASSNDVTEMLEELSSTDLADAEALAVTLENNENVEESFSSDDGQSLFVQFKDDDVCSVYPMKQLRDPFDEEIDDYSSYAKYNSQMRMKAAPHFRAKGSLGKVAVFNYFSNQLTRDTQNKMLEYMMLDLNNHGYGVEYYPYEEMTLDNLLAVYNSSTQYTAVVIISHGFTKDNTSYYVTGEEYDESKTKESRYVNLFGSGEVASDKEPFKVRFWNEGFGAIDFDGRYVFALRVKNYCLKEGDNALILYMGSCDAYPDGKNKNGTCVGWSGTQSTAQAHVTLMFYNLMRGKTLRDALDDPGEKSFYYYDKVGTQNDTWKEDPITYAKMECQFKGVHSYDADDIVPPKTLTPHIDYYRNGSSWLTTDYYNDHSQLFLVGPVFLSDNEYKIKFIMKDVANSGLCPDRIYVKATPLRSDAAPTIYTVKKKKETIFKTLKISLPKNGIYVITAAVDEEFTNEILIMDPIIFVKAKPFKENGTDWDEPVLTCPDDDHPHLIDLGLPSGTLWACCNVGADAPEDYGGYYSWGETEEKDYYDWSTYIHCDGSRYRCHDIGKDIADTQYDAATVNWGRPWVMPNSEQMKELLDNCTSEWTTMNGVNGRRFTASNGASIFLPAAGYHYSTNTGLAGQLGDYWTSSLVESDSQNAYGLYFMSDYAECGSLGGRSTGVPVRPVCKN